MAKHKPLDPKEDRSLWHCHRCGLAMTDTYPGSNWFVKLVWNNAGYWECDRTDETRARLCDKAA